jgi:hypothetical protein
MQSKLNHRRGRIRGRTATFKASPSDFLASITPANRDLANQETRRVNMLWTIFVVLLILWLLGFSLHVAGGLIHLLLVVALVVLVINLVSGRRVA